MEGSCGTAHVERTTAAHLLLGFSGDLRHTRTCHTSTALQVVSVCPFVSTALQVVPVCPFVCSAFLSGARQLVIPGEQSFTHAPLVEGSPSA